ncbi:MAG: glycerol-3-phosphate dehydrogenase C-terminal domain-containing protein, partial [Verrucomicrobiota bacterium]
AGLRPLLAGPAQTPSETSREHTIAAAPDRTVVVAGGKLTTLRRMGEETVDVVAELLRAAGLERALAPCTTATRPLPGAAGDGDRRLLDGQGADVRTRLACYGDRAAAVLELANLPELAGRIHPGLPYLWAEVLHAARFEQARTLTDVLVRRVPLFRDAADQGLAAAERAAVLVGAELGWSPQRRDAEVAGYRDAVAVSRRWRDEIA